MANYHPAFAVEMPSDDSIKDFIAKFYTISDTPGKNTEWVNFFQDDATLVMEKKSATGKTGMHNHYNYSHFPPNTSAKVLRLII